MSDLAKRIAALSPQQRAIFEQRLQQQGLSAQALQPIPRRQTTDLPPLSLAQQRLWFLDQMEPGNPFYNDTRAVRLEGPLDLRAVHRALNEIVRRHETLRTSFALRDGQPVQCIAPALLLPLPLLDLRALPPAHRDDATTRLAAAQAAKPFDLTRLPLLRTTLLRLDPRTHVLLLTAHHIVSDGWSADVLIHEVATLYEAFATSQPSPLPELPIQYADYALWQRQWLQGAVLDAQLAYWRRQLVGAPPLLTLPTDYPRPAVKTYRGATSRFALAPSLSAALAALAQREGVTLFMLLLAAFKVVLARYTGQTDVVVGTLIANRTRTELASLIGFFANTLVLRSDVGGNPRFVELAQRVRAVTLGAYAHQDLSFEMLVKVMQPTRELSYTPLFQVTFALQKLLVPRLERAGVRISALELGEPATAKFDLSLFMWEAPEQLNGTVEYSSELFEATTIARLIGHMQTVLAAIAAGPEQRILELPLLTTTERRQILVEWNETVCEYRRQESGVTGLACDAWVPASASASLHELIAAQAARTPDAVAVVFDGRTTGDWRLCHEPRNLSQRIC